MVDLVFDAAAGSFNISRTTEELFEFEREGTLGKYSYSIKDLDSIREVRFNLEEGRLIRGNLRNNVELQLNPNPVWDIKLDVGAANVDMDLSEFKVSKLDIDGGASAIDLRIGELQEECWLKINSGASSIDIEIPEEFACEITTNTILSSKDLEGFNKISNGTYVTDDFSDRSKNIIIEVDAAVSSLNVERY
jgi:hypothetical protein